MIAGAACCPSAAAASDSVPRWRGDVLTVPAYVRHQCPSVRGGPRAMPHLSATPDLAARLGDMEGTIVDTEPHWITAGLDMAAEHGGRRDEQLATDLSAMPLENSARELQQR